MKKIEKIKKIFLCITSLTLLVGICLIIWPMISATVLSYLLGILLLIIGIIRLDCYFRGGLEALLFLHYELPIGLLNIFIAMIFILYPKNMVIVLPILIGIMIIFDSIFQLQFIIEFKKLSMKRWWMMVISFIVCICFALLLISNPFEGSRLLMIFIGISLILDSIQNIFIIFSIERYLNEIMPIEVEYKEK